MKAGDQVVLSTLLFSLLLANPVSAKPNPAGQNRGFRALDGKQANAFKLPNDVSKKGNARFRRGRSSERYQQTVNGAEVLGGQLSLIRDAGGKVNVVIGSHYPRLRSANALKLKPAEAKDIAIARIGRAGSWRTRLMIHPQTGRQFHLVENRRNDSRLIHWIDAEDGSILNRYDALTTGSGIGVHDDLKNPLDTSPSGQNGYELVSQDERIKTYDALNSRRGLPGTLRLDSDDVWDDVGSTSPGHPALVDAHFYSKLTDSYYFDLHGFNWTAYYPQGVVSSVHFSRNMNNAFWTGSQAVYGDGDGNTLIELSGDLDVVAHELSHGVTEATSGLIYQNESGALNEAFSDIMGTVIEFYYGSGNWTIGEDITPARNGFRNMSDPGEDGHPSHYAARYTGTGDNGGVHINSGIVNHWFYLLVEGGQNSNPAYSSGVNVAGIGITDAADIAFLGLTSLNATANFCDARAATIAIADASQSGNVRDAWNEVGVDEALCFEDDGSDTGDAGPTISDVTSNTLRRGYFSITWSTDIPATSSVIFEGIGTYPDSTLVTAHSRVFRGTRGATYIYHVSSTDVLGNEITDGPYTHDN